MKFYFKLNLMLSYGIIVSQLGAMDPELMHKLLGQKEIREAICNNLSEKEINVLSQANRQVRSYVDPVIDERMTERAINYSEALSAVELKCGEHRRNFPDNEGFGNYVLQSINDCAAHNPGRCIRLNLEINELGLDPAFFDRFMHDIIDLVHKQNTEIIVLNLQVID